MRTHYDVTQLAIHKNVPDAELVVHTLLNYDTYKNSFFIHSIWDDYAPVKGSYWITTNRIYERMRNYK